VTYGTVLIVRVAKGDYDVLHIQCIQNEKNVEHLAGKLLGAKKMWKNNTLFLFNDAFLITQDYVASNERMIGD
jgi:hypothetical protein